jgi:hypothetical protein
MSRATEGFSASTATFPDSADAIVLFQFSDSGKVAWWGRRFVSKIAHE